MGAPDSDFQESAGVIRFCIGPEPPKQTPQRECNSLPICDDFLPQLTTADLENAFWQLYSVEDCSLPYTHEQSEG